MNMQVNRIAETIWEIPTTEKAGMLVPARIYATEQLFNAMDETVYDQITNVATLPGITKYAMCMPDGHSGYGFPIGGVAAMDVERGGVISPGGIGFDINCGMRLVVTNLTYEEVKPHIQTLVDRLFQRVPAGVGSTGFVKLSRPEFRRVVEQGARWCIQNGYGWPEDLELTEESGCIAGADAAKISDKAIDRGVNQIGTLGSGNHYLEIQVAHRDHIHDEDAGTPLRHHHPGSGGDHVSLRQPWIRPPGGHRLSTGLFAGDGEQVPYQNPRPRAGLRPVQCA